MSQVPKSMHSALSKDMTAFEEKLITTNFKFGVLYWKDGETEDDMYKTGRLSFGLMTELASVEWTLISPFRRNITRIRKIFDSDGRESGID